MEADRRVLLAIADARFRVGLTFFLCAVVVGSMGVYLAGNNSREHFCGNNDAPDTRMAKLPPMPSKDLSNYLRGEKLFKANCASCHKPDKDMTGPALRGSRERWARSGGDLYAWVKNSQGYLKAGKDPYAKALFEKWKGSQMTPNAVSDEDIDLIMAFVDGYHPPAIAVP